MHPIEISESAGIRNLHFGSDWVQGAMRICRPHALVLEYTQVMMASLLLRDAGEQFKRWPRRALLIGLGAGSALLMATFVLKLVEMRTQRDALVLIYLGFFAVVAAYLLCSFLSGGWHYTWVIWPAAGPLFAALSAGPYWRR